MSNLISCPKCERQLRVPDDLIGQSVKCPSCSETFTAALSKTEPPPVPSAPRPRDDEPPSRRPPPRRDDYDDAPVSRRNLAPHRGDTIQLLGILSFFIAGPILGPMAWIMGNKDLKEMDAGRMDPSGRGSTSTGRMCGMIATIIYVVVLVISLSIPLGICCCGIVGGASSGGH